MGNFLIAQHLLPHKHDAINNTASVVHFVFLGQCVYCNSLELIKICTNCFLLDAMLDSVGVNFDLVD